MDLKLVSYVLSLILLVTYGTEARKMVEENSQFPLFYKQGAEDKHQQALKENTESVFPLFYKQGSEDKHQQALKENTESVFPLFYKQGAEDKHQQALKENTESVFPLFYKQGAEDKHQQALKENTESVFPLFYKQGAEDKHQQALKENTESVFPLFYKQGAEDKHQQMEAEDKHQQALKENTESVFSLFYKQGAEDKHQQALKENTESVFPLFYKQGAEDKHQQAGAEDKHQQTGAEDKHQQALKENTESVFPLFYKQGAEDKHQQSLKENTESVSPLFYKQGAEDKHQQALKENEHIHSSSHMDHIDPSLRIFFLMDDLKSWKAITVSFSRRALVSSLQFFPKEAADSIPFSLKELPNLLQRFSFSKDSPQAKAMEQTIRSCEDSPIKGETKYCATSMEAMLDFVHVIMGEKTQIEALTNTKTQEVEAIAAQNYTFLDAPQEVAAPKMVACHTLPCAYPVFFCHYTISKSKVFKVSLRNDANGDRIEAIVLCHLDTSGWSPSHVAFRALGILPGTSPLCHFIPSDNLVWVPKTIANGHEAL